jgi:hypothetical protein
MRSMIPAKGDHAAGPRGVTVEAERGVAGGWEFDVILTRGTDQSKHCVRLAWVDYEYWSHGAAAPERVARAVVEALLELAPARELPRRFDASVARRWVTEGAAADERIRERLADPGGVG